MPKYKIKDQVSDKIEFSLEVDKDGINLVVEKNNIKNYILSIDQDTGRFEKFSGVDKCYDLELDENGLVIIHDWFYSPASPGFTRKTFRRK